MSTLDDIAQERQRIAERLARIDSERAKLAEQLGELEAAERVLSRFSQPKAAGGRRGRRARTAEPAKAVKPAKSTKQAEPRRRQQRRGRARGAAPAKSSLALGDATFRAVSGHGHGATAEEVREYLAREFSMQVRPNHLGMALQRHRRGGRLEQRDGRWFARSAEAD
jgi:hypothetical protein